MGRLLRWFRALLSRVNPAEVHDVEDSVYAGSRRLLELADAARTSAAQLVAARARLDRELAALPKQRGELAREALTGQRDELMRQQEAAEQQAHQLAEEAASLRSFAQGMAADQAAATSRARTAELKRRQVLVARAARDTVREAEDETMRLVARGRALDELRELEEDPALRPVREDGVHRPSANP